MDGSAGRDEAPGGPPGVSLLRASQNRIHPPGEGYGSRVHAQTGRRRFESGRPLHSLEQLQGRGPRTGSRGDQDCDHRRRSGGFSLRDGVSRAGTAGRFADAQRRSGDQFGHGLAPETIFGPACVRIVLFFLG